MAGVKRPNPFSEESSKKISKLPGLSCEVKDEEDFELILERIRQQEESEALAKRLQAEFNSFPDNDVIDLTRDESEPFRGSSNAGPSTEGDEAMARRLAREWSDLDGVAGPSPKISVESPLRNKIFQHPISNPSIAAPVNPEEDLQVHRDIFTRSRKCTMCHKTVPSPRNLVVFSSNIPPPTILALLHAVCEDCGQSHCRGCFRVLKCPKHCKGKQCKVSECCAEIRAIAIFEALGGLDIQYLRERSRESFDLRKKSTPMIDTVGPGGTGYSTASCHTYAIEYRPKGKVASNLDSRENQQAQSSKAIAARWDDIIIRGMETITHFLPAPYADGASVYDLLPHPSIRSLISMSYLPEILGVLLINDSVDNWIDRPDIYNSMLKLLRRMADSELTVGALVEQKWEKKKSVGLCEWMWSNGSIEWERTSNNEIIRAPPLYNHFEKLSKQCQTFLSGAPRVLQDDGDGEVQEMAVKATSLCGDMISARDDLQRAFSVIMRGATSNADPSNPYDKESNKCKEKGKGKGVNVEIEKRYSSVCGELAFKYATLSTESPGSGLAYDNFHYAKEVVTTAGSKRLPSKWFHLIKELSAVSTSLPPGVWVRVDEVRNDVLKIMIAGPEGTPYAGGLFEFHCFIPLDYPDGPPKVKFATTGAGTVRFNPNLYADGKVCLSLLGTWSGRPEEKWTSKSTLLQVLVSIQSMIFVEGPYFNEPGYGQVDLSNEKSISYNKNISLQTVHWAMIEWMKEEHKNGIWADVIAAHFSIRKDKIRKCIWTWANADPDNFQRYSVSVHKSTWGFGNPNLMGHQVSWRGNHSPQLGSINLLSEFENGCTFIEGWTKEPCD